MFTGERYPITIVDMEHVPGLKILNQIPMESRKIPRTMSFEARKRAAEILPAQIREVALRINEALLCRLADCGVGELISPDDGRIVPDAFCSEVGGPYNDERIGSDRELVASRRVSFGVNTGSVDAFVRKSLPRPGEIGEESLFCVLNRILGGRYAVARTEAYDDYENLVDFLIVDLERGGKPICAIDEFVGDEQDADEAALTRVRKKKERLHREGGMRVRYGIGSEKGSDLRLGGFEGLAGVYAAVKPGTLEALYAPGSSFTDSPSEAEWEFFAEVVASIGEDVSRDAVILEGNPVKEFLRVAAECLSTRTVIGREKA